MAKHMTFDEASKLMNETPNYSQLVLMPGKQHIKLPPKYIGSVQKGVSEVMKSKMLFYNNELDGVPVAFRNVKALQKVGRIMSDQTCLHFDIQADFILFKPTTGCLLKGVINKVGKKHIGCLVHDCFNGWVPRSELADHAEIDLLGKTIEFHVLETSSNNRVISLRGDFHKLVTEPEVGKKGKKSKAKTKAIKVETSEIDSLDDSLQMEPLLTSLQIETPAPSTQKHNPLSPGDDTRHLLQIKNTLVRQLLQELSDQVGKKGKKSKAKTKAIKVETTEVDSLDDSLQMEPLLTSTQIETPAPSSQKHKKHRKNKHAEAELSSLGLSLTKRSLDLSDSGVKEETISDDLGGVLGSDDSASQSAKKQKKKKKKSKRSVETDTYNAQEGLGVKQEPKEVVSEPDKVVSEHSEKKRKKEKKRKLNQEQITTEKEIKTEVVCEATLESEQGGGEKKKKNLKRKLTQDYTEAANSSMEFASPQKKMKKVKKEKHTEEVDTNNDSNNNFSKHKKSKKKKSKLGTD